MSESLQGRNVGGQPDANQLFTLSELGVVVRVLYLAPTLAANHVQQLKSVLIKSNQRFIDLSSIINSFFH